MNDEIQITGDDSRPWTKSWRTCYRRRWEWGSFVESTRLILLASVTNCIEFYNISTVYLPARGVLFESPRPGRASSRTADFLKETSGHREIGRVAKTLDWPWTRFLYDTHKSESSNFHHNRWTYYLSWIIKDSRSTFARLTIWWY